jgi:capsular exopolysaccharide synthesis family protein
VTSALPKEGKSRTAANLSVALAAAGHRTLLIDCDFRRSVQHRLFGRIRNIGLADVMLGDATEAEAVARVEQVPNLWLLCSGPTPPNPSELLGSARMRELLARLAENFSHVVIDTPPVNVVADALVLGSYTDATLVVVDYGRSRYPTVRGARESLQRVGARVLGGVLNKVPTREGYGYYYNYSENGKASRQQRGAKDMKETKELAAAAVSEEPPG